MTRYALAKITILGAVTAAAGACAGPGHPGTSTAAPGRPLTEPVMHTAAPTSDAPPTTTIPPSTAPPTVSTTSSTTAAPTTPPSVQSAAVASPATACPQSLAASLASTGSATQLITAEASGYDTTAAAVELWEKQGACWQPVGGPWPAVIGQNGFSDHHTEGDSTTPTGLYPIGPTIYGNSPDPGTIEPYHQLVCGDWWDEDPTSPAYNTFQELPCGAKPPFAGGSEALWTETAPYPSFAVVDYNTGPVVPYAGSAIFIHADVGVPTTGCLSLPLADLDAMLRWLDPAHAPAIAMGPASEITSF